MDVAGAARLAANVRRALIEDGYLLDEDLQAILERAEQRWDYVFSTAPEYLSRE